MASFIVNSLRAYSIVNLNLLVGLLVSQPNTFAASPFVSDYNHQVVILPASDLAIRYKDEAEGLPVRASFDSSEFTDVIKQKPTSSIELSQDFSSINRCGLPEKILLLSYCAPSIGNLKQLAFSADFNHRNDCHLSLPQWSKEAVCNWVHLTSDTSRLVNEYAIYDVHSLGKKKKISIPGGSFMTSDPILDYKIIFWKIGNQIFMLYKQAGGLAGLEAPVSTEKFYIEFQIKKKSLAPSKWSID